MNKKYFWIGGLVIIIIIAAIVLVNQSGSLKYGNSDEQILTQSSTETMSQTESQTQSQTQTQSKTVVATKKVVKPAAAADTTYTDAIKQYEGRRFQINSSCQVTPFYVTYTNNTSVMLDNRSDSIKVVKFDATAYSVPAFGFKIVKISSKTLPHEISIDCGSRYNVGRILLQK